MDFINPLPAVACMLVAIATAFLLTKQFGAPPEQGRYAAIDGLRGYLAFFVFLHHSCIWYYYLRTGQWQVPNSNLYTHFGQSSVLVFFMITGFLFFSKLIDGRTKSIDWGRLFISRFLRLVPLYLFAMLLLFIIVAYLSGGILHETLPALIGNILLWLGFTIFGAPDLNGFPFTLIIAGVTWSLPYEWLFYFSLPLLALIVGVMPPIPYLALGAACVAVIMTWNPQFHPYVQMTAPLLSFVGGISAALLVRWELFRQFAAQWFSSLIVLGCLVWVVAAYPSVNGPIPLLLLSVAFALVACGNNMFGTLTSPVSRTLGEMAYSLYLLHGILLFVVFSFILGKPQARELTPEFHWLWVAGVTPVLVLICFATFRFIESPAMQSTTSFTAWLRARLNLRPKAANEQF